MTDNTDPQEQKPKRRRVKKVKGHGGHHGGAWKVAYADFVTAMMALFLVLWLVSQADTKLKKEIANYFRSPGVFSSTDGGILPGQKNVSREPDKLTEKEERMVLFEAANKLKQSLEKDIGSSKINEKVKIEVVEEGIRIQVVDKADDISFEVGGSTLNEAAKAILKEIAETICSLPNPIKIGGHTDARIFQSANGYTNWELSTDRANAARRYLQSVCVKPEQIKRITGYADTVPLFAKDVYHPANRRISITILRIADDDKSKEENNVDKESEESKENEDINSKNFLEPIKPVNQAVKETHTSKIEEKSAQEKKVDEKSTDVETKDTTKKEEVAKKVKEVKADSKETLKKKLATDGQVVVGKPDIVPDIAKKQKEKPAKP